MRIGVIGGGSMGSLFAARLQAAGNEVWVAEHNGARRSAIEMHGIRMVLRGQLSTTPVRCVEVAALPQGCDLLLLLTKFAELRSALSGARHALSGAGAALALANGLGVANMLAGLVDPAQLLLGVTEVAADLRDGVVHSDGAGAVTIGPSRPANVGVGASDVCDALSHAGFDVAWRPDMSAAIWGKVAFNAAFNALAAIVGAPVYALDRPAGRRIIDAVLAEVTAVAQAQGVAFDDNAVRAKIDAAFACQSDHVPSMLQDRRAGRRTEIAAINQAIAEQGEGLGIPVPANRFLTDLIVLTGG